MSHIRIGELSERTGVPRRLLRYYEAQGLLQPRRTENGYRGYDDRHVERVVQIRGLLDAGLPTRLIAELMPCLDNPPLIYCTSEATPEMLAKLENERDRMTERIAHLTRNRDAIVGYISRARANGSSASQSASTLATS